MYLCLCYALVLRRHFKIPNHRLQPKYCNISKNGYFLLFEDAAVCWGLPPDECVLMLKDNYSFHSVFQLCQLYRCIGNGLSCFGVVNMYFPSHKDYLGKQCLEYKVGRLQFSLVLSCIEI